MVSTRTLLGIGLILLGTGMLVFGLVPALSAFSALLAVAAIFLTAGTYLVGTDVSGRVV
jgi:sugar phosphate permease